jgi:hypothetical protein
MTGIKLTKEYSLALLSRAMPFGAQMANGPCCSSTHPVRIAFEGGGRIGHFSGTIPMDTFGSDQDVWHGSDATAHADPNLPLVVSSIDVSAQTVFPLPKASVTVLRGALERLTAWLDLRT